MEAGFFFQKIDVKTRWNFQNCVRQLQFLHRKLLFHMAIGLHYASETNAAKSDSELCWQVV